MLRISISLYYRDTGYPSNANAKYIPGFKRSFLNISSKEAGLRRSYVICHMRSKVSLNNHITQEPTHNNPIEH